MRSRIARSALVLLAPCAGSLPLGGCLGFLLGYAMGSADGHAQETHIEGRMDAVERLVTRATLSEGPCDRRAALEKLRHEYLSPTVGDPASVRARADQELARLAETLDDPEPSVAAAGRLLLTEMVGTTVGLAHDDRVAIESMKDAGQQTEVDPAEVKHFEAAHSRACAAALRAYAMARLGVDMRDAAPLLRRGIAFPLEPREGNESPLAVYCAMALVAATGEVDAALPVLVEGTRREDVETRYHRTGGWPFGGVALETRVSLDAAIAAVIGIGRAGPAGASALPTLRKIAAAHDDFVMRRAAETAVGRIEGPGGPRPHRP